MTDQAQVPSNVVDINEQKVKDLEEKLRAAELRELREREARLSAQLGQIQTATALFQEQFPRLQQELSLTQAKIK